MWCKHVVLCWFDLAVRYVIRHKDFEWTSEVGPHGLSSPNRPLSCRVKLQPLTTPKQAPLKVLPVMDLWSLKVPENDW